MNIIEHNYQNVIGAFTFPNFYYQIVQKFDNAEFVEVGVNYGQSACFMGVEIINNKKNIKLNLIDDWDASYCENGYDTFQQNILPVKNIMGNNLNIIRERSVPASSKFENESLDFIFIDACHDYDCVIEDLNAWFPKIKKGGIIAGHDYYDGHYGVEKAVNEFFYRRMDKLKSQEYCWIYFND